MSLPQIEPGAHKTILLVNNDNIFINQIATAFKNEGYGVVIASDGQTASTLFDAYADQIVLVVLDVLLPKKDGFTVLGEIKGHADYGHIPVVILSNMDAEDDIKKAKEMGAKEYIISSKTSILAIIQRMKELMGVLK